MKQRPALTVNMPWTTFRAGTANFTVYAEGYVVYSEANMEVRHGMPEKNVALNFHTLSGKSRMKTATPFPERR